MRKPFLLAAALALAVGTLTACGADDTPKSGEKSSDSNPALTGTPAEAPAKASTASDAFTQLSTKVTSAKLSGTVTADNDPNKLLGRPGQYTSKITFTDSRITSKDVEFEDEGSVGLGGAIEVFATAADAQARATYIKNVTKSMPMLAEYDYVSGTVLVRVSHYLTPDQADDYEAAATVFK